jgi:FHA domain-containing protein
LSGIEYGHMDLPQILVTAGVGLAASLVTAVATHLLTRAQERRKHERDVAAKLAELNSSERAATLVMATQYAQACLIVELPGQTERDRVFLPIGSRITLGRSAENHIRIDDPLVSRMHASFRALGTSAYVEPLGPAHGLAINNTAVNKPTKLSEGDVITVPGASFKISFVSLVR